MESLIFALVYVLAWVIYIILRHCFDHDMNRLTLILIDLLMLVPVLNIILSVSVFICFLIGNDVPLKKNRLSKFLFNTSYKQQYGEDEQ